MRRIAATALVFLCSAALGACTTSDVLEPSAMVGTGASSPPPAAVSSIPPPAAGPATAAVPGPLAAVPADVRLQFAPIIGATVEAVTPLTERLLARSRERGIGLAGSGDPSTTHMLKGYFSAITEADGTTVLYVWDVLDQAGNRLHRIQGQQKIGPAAGESWQAVPPDTMRLIGDATIDQFAAWVVSRQG